MDWGTTTKDEVSIEVVEDEGKRKGDSDAGAVLTRISSDKTNQEMSFMCHTEATVVTTERESPKM